LHVLLKSFACPLEALLGKTLDSTTISSVAKTLEQELKAKSCAFDEFSKPEILHILVASMAYF